MNDLLDLLQFTKDYSSLTHQQKNFVHVVADIISPAQFVLHPASPKLVTQLPSAA